MRVLSDLAFRWSRRSTLAFVAFAVIVVAFTALALSWNGLSAFRHSANADPGIGPFVLTLPRTAPPTPTPPPQNAAAIPSPSVAPVVQSPLPMLSPHPTTNPAVKTKAKHTRKPKATHTPKPKPTPTPKAQTLYIHTPLFTRTPKRKAQYPPAAPPLDHYGVLAGAAGHNYAPH
jgi:outer membrane biosynthesis protein TonB